MWTNGNMQIPTALKKLLYSTTSAMFIYKYIFADLFAPRGQPTVTYHHLEITVTLVSSSS
jgi:hypothetical protein